MKLDRRVLLAGAAAAALAGAFFHFRSAPELLPEELAGLFRRYRTQARRLGERYIECAPSASASQEIVSELQRHGQSANANLPIRALVADRIMRDFRKGRTVIVDGWLLSETEAKLCALVAERG